MISQHCLFIIKEHSSKYLNIEGLSLMSYLIWLELVERMTAVGRSLLRPGGGAQLTNVPAYLVANSNIYFN